MASDIRSTVISPSGYYLVGSDVYVSKSEALTIGTQNNIYPKWKFFTDIWRQQDWTSPPQIDVYTLYQARARQLREKYDYICLSFSGGSDSTTMLQAFIDSGCFIDEVLVKWPIKATAKYSATIDRDPANILSEWELTVLPQLNHYQNLLGPKTQFTVVDWSDQVFERESSEDIIWHHSQDHLNPSTYIRQSCLSEKTHAAIDAGKKTCIVFGIDKPQIGYRKGWLYCYFLDKLAHTHAYHPWDQYVELFYWTPDFPEIVSTQSKIIYQYLLMHPHFLRLLDLSTTIKWEDKVAWDIVVRTLIYPEYMKHRWFQARKPTSFVYDEIDQWMYSDTTVSKYLQSWKSHLQNRFSNIDEKYIDCRDGKLHGYVGFIDGMYLLGPISNNPQG